MKYFIFVFLISCPIAVWSQVSGNANYHQQEILNKLATAEVYDQEITFSVSGLLNANADTFVAFFHVAQVGETAEKTDSLMTRRTRKFKAMLKKFGVDSTSVSTDLISFVPKYGLNVITKLFSKAYNEVPAGFELQKNIMVRYKKASSLDAIVTAAAMAEIYDLVKVDYFLSDVKREYDQLRQKCMEALKERIKSYEVIGVTFDTAKKSVAEDFGTILPQGRYSQYQAVARPAMDGLKRTSSVSEKINFANLTPSRYYQAVPFDEYDVVINPTVSEPMVQLTYQVKVKFMLAPAEVKDKGSFLLMTPNGQLQKVDLRNFR